MTVEAAELETAILAVLGCSPEVAVAIAAHAVARDYPAQAAILRYGDAWTYAHLVMTGRARALVYGADGQMVLVHEYRPGDFFGAIGLADLHPAEADVIAVDPTRTACVPGTELVILVDRHGSLGLLLVRRLLEQLRATSGRMVERMTLSAPGRVYAEILRLARLGDGEVIRPAPVLAALAVRVQSTRETVSRAVNALERRGIVRREDDALIIVAARRLEELVI